MAKTHKKKRVMKKTVRKTIGSLFLASAIAVAAVPVENLQAEVGIAAASLEDEGGIYIDIDPANPTGGYVSPIPKVVDKATIYSTMDGVYQFAYVTKDGKDDTSDPKSAVILGYNPPNNLDKATLEIPNQVDAYLQYRDNNGEQNGWVAVGKNGNFLFYDLADVKTEDENEPAGDVSSGDTEPPVEHVYLPCYSDSVKIWGEIEANDPKKLFYYPNNDETKPIQPTSTNEVQRLSNVNVSYIGNQYVRAKTMVGGARGYEIAGMITKPSDGIFYAQSNISILKVGSNLIGIGEYAFAGCANLSGLDLTGGNGLNTIGNYAFYQCINMGSIDMPLVSNIRVIGAHAFEDCRALKDFNIPISIGMLGNYAFKDCGSLTNINLQPVTADNNRTNMMLSEIGMGVFAGCTNLSGITFPDGFSNNGKAIEIDTMFEGCKLLGYISSANLNLDFKESAAGGFADFKSGLMPEVQETFYFEGKEGSSIHNVVLDKAKKQEFAFSYLHPTNSSRLNKYEVVKYDGDPEEADARKVIFTAAMPDSLIGCKMDEGLTTLTFPAYVGPCKITAIGGTAFQNNCFLRTVTIPNSITNIDSGAFKGCHRLKYVNFTGDSPNMDLSIGSNAFKTQSDCVHSATCKGISDDGYWKDPNTPELYFTGCIAAGYAPFEYAMDRSSNINVGNQTDNCYITYYSGWPNNLEVRYNPATDKNELVDYPTLTDIAEKKYNESAYPSYITPEYADAVSGDAVRKYFENSPTLTTNEKKVVAAAVNLVLPDGIESIKAGLFTDNAEKERLDSLYFGNLEKKKTLTAQSLEEVAPGSFKDFINLSEVDLNKTKSIGDYAFEGCKGLYYVGVPDTVTTLGKAPFLNCDVLENVSFAGKNFVCDNSIIFSLDLDGNKVELIEYLKGRDSGVVDIAETEGVKSIAEDAFRGTGVSSVDLKRSKVQVIPSMAFAETDQLFQVLFPNTTTTIRKDAFRDSSIKYLDIPESVNYIDASAFSGDKTKREDITVCCVKGGTVERIVTEMQMKTKDKPPEYIVNFLDWDFTLLDTQVVEGGKDAVPPEVSREGYRLTGWYKDYKAIDGNRDCQAQYELIILTHTVTFLDADSNPIKVLEIPDGNDVRSVDIPAAPSKPGSTFIGWSGKLTNITEDLFVSPVFAEDKDAEYLVTFLIKTDEGETVHSTQLVKHGTDAIIPKDPVMEGQTFRGWWPEVTNVTSNINTYAQFVPNGSIESTRFKVLFYDHDNTIISSQLVYLGEGAVTPQDPAREGYIFTGWRPADFSSISKDMDIYAQYEKIAPSDTPGGDIDTTRFRVLFYDHDNTIISSQLVFSGEGAVTPQSPAREGYIFTGWRPADFSSITKDMDIYAQYEKIATSDTPGGNDNPGNITPSPAPAPKLYNLTVRNGSGSGSYVAGSQPIIIANDPAAGQEFSHWTIDPADTKLASSVLTASVVTMPERDVTVTANYKAKTTSSNGGGTAPDGTGNRPNGTTGVVSSGTTVVIDKNGLSNTGVVSATVHGSSDNFTIKVTESTAASEAVLKALQAEYGALDNIKYFPMDISLYDSTGTKLITDTSGLTISITLPLPDSLIEYAGNNKVAGVVNNRLDKLSPKFTTIDKVPCVTFTAEHFSPYVIYVETNRLEAGSAIDSTPKTGDGIHPKWFLAVGLACMSAVFFMKRDKRSGRTVKTA